MKRIFILLTLPFLILLSSCKSSEPLDCTMFCELFNNRFEQYKINSESVIIQSNGDETSFYLFINNDESMLINLISGSKDLRIKKVCLTFSSPKDEMQKKNSQEFLKLCKSLIDIFSLEKDNPEKIIKSLNTKSGEKYAFSYPSYFETNFYRYSYQANKFGASFIIENKLLCENPQNELTLRQEK